MQTNGDQTACLNTAYSDRNEAESNYYRVLSAAAVSNVPMHSAALLNEKGNCLKSDFYDHTEEA